MADVALKQEKAKLVKSLKRWDLVFFGVCAIIGLDAVAGLAKWGLGQGITWFIIFVFLFLLPYGLVTAELGAAYAADGYARVRGFGALLTTFGVGELSAINGVAGSFAERVPLLHLTVGPAQAMEDAEAVVHHTAGDGDFSRFARAHESVTCAQGVLRADNAAAEIDRVLIAALGERRPGYLRMPSDVGRLRVPAPRQPLPRPEPDVDAAELARFVDVARDRVATAGSMAVLADFLAGTLNLTILPAINPPPPV